MKTIKNYHKYIALGIGLMMFATPIYAQEAPAILSLQQEYQNALVQLITLLQAQVQSLILQLQSLHDKQDVLQLGQTNNQTQTMGSTKTTDEKIDDLTKKVDTIIQQVTPTPEPIIVPVDKSDLIVIGGVYSKEETANGGHRSLVNFKFQVNNKEGKEIKKPSVHIIATFDGKPFQEATTTDLWYPDGDTGYNPTLIDKGTYDFTFTANGITKTAQVIVE